MLGGCDVGAGSAARDGAHDVERLRTGSHRVGQQGIGRIVRHVFLAREEPHEPAPPLRRPISNRALQHRIPRLERIEDGALRDRAVHVELYLTRHVREGAELRRQYDPDHGRVCTSTDNTAGRSRTIGSQ